MQSRLDAARRALALAFMSLRAHAEGRMRHFQETYQDSRDWAEDVIRWAADQKIDTWLSPEEKKAQDEPLGSWDESTTTNNFWRVESLKSVLWAIGQFDAMPSYLHEGVDAAFERIPMHADVAPFLAAAELRPKEALYAERHIAEFYHWRVVTEVLRLRGMQPPRGDTYEAVVARALDGIDLPVPHDGTDILVDGTRFIDLDDERKQAVISIGYERHLALCWITSDDPWDEARADT